MPNITRWDPFSLQAQLDEMFNNMLAPRMSSISQGSTTMDVYTEDGNQLLAEVHAPGFTKDDIEINVHNGVLEIKGEKHEKEEQKGKRRNYVMRESHSSFYRSVALPKTAEGDKVKASFDEGVLKITVPLKELPGPKKIAIESNQKK